MRPEPVFIITVANSCAGMSVCIERITATSSMHSPIFGKISLTSTPDLPRLVNLKTVGNGVPPISEMFLSALRASAGFGSHVSMCDGPPCAKMWMTCFAFAEKCGFRGASGDTPVPTALAVPESNCSPSIAARPKPPMPVPKRFKNSRRV